MRFIHSFIRAGWMGGFENISLTRSSPSLKQRPLDASLSFIVSGFSLFALLR